MITVTLTYADGSTWFAGGFATMALAEAWIDEERTRPYWQHSTSVTITDNTPATTTT